MKKVIIIFVVIFLILTACNEQPNQNENSSSSLDISNNSSMTDLKSENILKENAAIISAEMHDVMTDNILLGVKIFYSRPLKSDLSSQTLDTYVHNENGIYLYIVPKYANSTVVIESMSFDENNNKFITTGTLFQSKATDDYALLLQTDLPESGPQLRVTVSIDGKSTSYEPAYDGRGDAYPYEKNGAWIEEAKNNNGIIIEKVSTYVEKSNQPKLYKSYNSEIQKYGYINNSGELLIAPQYDRAYDFSEGLAVATIGTCQYVINSNNETIFWIVSKPGSSYLGTEYSDGLLNITVDLKDGFIDKNGNWVITPQFDSALAFSEELAMFSVKTVISQPYTDDDGRLITPVIEQKFGFINKLGNVVVKADYDMADDFSEGFSCVKKGDKYGYIDYNGNAIIPFIYDSAYSFSEGVAPVAIDGKWGVIDKYGSLVIQAEFEDIGTCSEGLLPAKQNDKWGYLSKNGEWVINPSYKYCFKFSEGLASVASEEWDNFKGKPLYGYINKNGEWVIKPKYIYADIFVGGIAEVSYNIKSVSNDLGYIYLTKYIDNHGNIVG